MNLATLKLHSLALHTCYHNNSKRPYFVNKLFVVFHVLLFIHIVSILSLRQSDPLISRQFRIIHPKVVADKKRGTRELLKKIPPYLVSNWDYI